MAPSLVQQGFGRAACARPPPGHEWLPMPPRSCWTPTPRAACPAARGAQGPRWILPTRLPAAAAAPLPLRGRPL
eukprot:9226236-Pyramimonas_sp.AAC.1